MRRAVARGTAVLRAAKRIRSAQPLAEFPTDLVRPLIEAVRRRGDEAVREATRKFDGVRPRRLLLRRPELDRALGRISPGLRASLEAAARNIERFHRRGAPARGFSVPVGRGRSRIGQRSVAVDRAGIYVPKGTRGYPSTVLMTVIPARLAGVGSVLVATPPMGGTGTAPDAVLAAAAIAGADEVLVAGGVAAIAAMAYGTRTVRPVAKIVGPGNRYVTAAKLVVSPRVGTDGLAGPSEVMVVADGTCSLRRLVLELLAQAEHDADATAIACLVGDRSFASVEREIAQRVPDPEDPVRRALERNGWLVRVPTIRDAIRFADAFAPEHLVLCVERGARWVPSVRRAGCVFAGSGATAPMGDYALGTNHVLPTAGSARFAGALCVGDFAKPVTYARLRAEDVRGVAAIARTIAEYEGFAWHREALDQWSD